MKIKNTKKYLSVFLPFSLILFFIIFLFPKNSNASSINVSPLKNLTSGLVGYWTMDGKDTPWTSSTAATTKDKSDGIRKLNILELRNLSQAYLF